MGDGQYRKTRFHIQSFEKCGDGKSAFPIQSAGGFIKEENFGRQQKTPNKAQALNLPHGQGHGMVVHCHILKMNFSQEMFNFLSAGPFEMRIVFEGKGEQKIIFHRSVHHGGGLLNQQERMPKLRRRISVKGFALESDYS